MEFTANIIENIRKIMNDKSLKQATMASYAGTSPSQFNKILSGGVQLSLKHLSNIARCLSMREIDIITYPDIYISPSAKYKSEEMEAVLQIKLSNKKREQVLNLVFGDRDIEVITK